MNTSALEIVEANPLPVATSRPRTARADLNDYALTDLGNAERLVARHGKDLRYCPAWRRWLVWDGRRWKVDDNGEVHRRAKETIREFQRVAIKIHDSGQKKSAVKHALNSESEGKIGAMVRLAQSEAGIPVTPDELDRDAYLLNCLNGTLDLKTGKLRTHRPEDLITRLVPVMYDENAACPSWETFLDRVLGGDSELVEYMQRAIGYALTGDVSEKAVFFLYGDGNNGKTTFLEAVRATLGDYAGQVPIQSLMVKAGSDGISNEIARLKGLRFVTSSEAEQGRKLAEEKVKLLTGMGKLQARFLYGEYFEFDPTFKIFMDANYKPEIRGTDAAIWNRMKLVPFTVEIPASEIDTKLLPKLRAELPGILAWAVQGCLKWQQSGLVEPSAVREATLGYRQEMDTIAHFIEDACTLGEHEITSKELYAAYREWCKEHEEEPVSAKHLGSALSKKGLKSKKVHGERGWSGITLKFNGPLFASSE